MTQKKNEKHKGVQSSHVLKILYPLPNDAKVQLSYLILYFSIIVEENQSVQSSRPFLHDSHPTHSLSLSPIFFSSPHSLTLRSLKPNQTNTISMESLFSEFTLLSSQALSDKNFDPFAIEDLMKLFEVEAYKSWAAMELHLQQEAEDAEFGLQEAEDELNSAMEAAMEEFRLFEEEMERMEKAELSSLEATAERERRMGKLMEKAATVASKRYIEAAMNSAAAAMRSAWKGISSNRVHPSWEFRIQIWSSISSAYVV